MKAIRYSRYEGSLEDLSPEEILSLLEDFQEEKVTVTAGVPTIWMGILAEAILFVCMFIGQRHRLDRWEGAALLALYGVFLYAAK